MKYVASIIAILLCASVVFAQTGPELKVVPKELDFGRVRQGESKTKVFSIRNVGFEDLIIDKMHTCCGYSVKDISSWQLAPGEKASLKVVCNASRKMVGADKKYITILSNDTSNPQLKIPTKALIIERDPNKPFVKKKRAAPVAVVSSIPHMDADEVNDRILKGHQVIMFDVREKSEYGHKYIPNSIRFARSKLADNEEELKDLIRNISKRTLIVVCCGSGTRSSYVTSKLRKLGYKAYNLDGGISAWSNKGYPIIMGPKLLPSEEGIAIDLEEVYEHYYKLFNKETQWVDVRPREAYKQGHIKGAVNVPLSEIERSVKSIPRSQNLVLYCDGFGCKSSSAAASILIKSGFKKGLVRVFPGGFSQWKEAGYPIEGSKVTR